MTACPYYYQYVFFPMGGAAVDKEDALVVHHSPKLIWQLRPRLGCAYYVCMCALEHGAREEDCSTPLFIGTDIPDYVLDYMNRYAKTMQVGAAWYRRNARTK